MGQRLRGSGDLHGWLDAALYFEKAAADTDVKISFELRYAVALEPVTVRIVDGVDFVRWGVVAGASDSTSTPGTGALQADRQLVVTALTNQTEGRTKDEIADTTGLSVRRVTKALKELGAWVEERTGQSTGGRPPAVFVLRSSGSSSLQHEPPHRGEASEKKKSDDDGPRGDSESQPPTGDGSPEPTAAPSELFSATFDRAGKSEQRKCSDEDEGCGCDSVRGLPPVAPSELLLSNDPPPYRERSEKEEGRAPAIEDSPTTPRVRQPAMVHKAIPKRRLARKTKPARSKGNRNAHAARRRRLATRKPTPRRRTTGRPGSDRSRRGS